MWVCVRVWGGGGARMRPFERAPAPPIPLQVEALYRETNKLAPPNGRISLETLGPLLELRLGRCYPVSHLATTSHTIGCAHA